MHIGSFIHNRIVSLIPDKVKEYFSFMCWFLPDSVWRWKGLSFAILATGFLGVTFQLQVFGLIISYARHFSTGKIINITGYAFDPRSSLGLLVLGSLLVAASLSFSAICIFFSKYAILRIGRHYEVFCSQRVFHALEKGNLEIAGVENSIEVNEHIGKLVRADARYCGRVLRMILSLIVPILTLIVWGAVLIYLEPVLTLTIIMALSIYLSVQYKISIKAAAHSIHFEKMSSLSGAEYKKLLKHFKQKIPGTGRNNLVNKSFAAGPVKQQLDAYEGRLLMPFVSELVSRILMAALLGIVLSVMGASIIREGSGWGRLIVYILVLRYAMTDLQISFSLLTSINRFYPQVNRHFLFVRNVEDKNDDVYFPQGSYEMRIQPIDNEKVLDGTLSNVVLRAGSRLALVSPQKLNHYTSASLIQTILGNSENTARNMLVSIQIVLTDHSCPDASLREVLGLKKVTTWIDLEGWFPDEVTWQKFKGSFPKDLDKPIRPQTWDVIDDTTKFILSLIAAQQSQKTCILIEAAGLCILEPEKASFFLEGFRDRIVIMVFNKGLKQIGTFKESAVAVIEEGVLWGVGSPEWFFGIREQVENMLKEKKSGHADKQDDVFEDDE